MMNEYSSLLMGSAVALAGFSATLWYMRVKRLRKGLAAQEHAPASTETMPGAASGACGAARRAS